MTIKQYVSQMRKIPGGRFTMGRTYSIKDKHGDYKDELPAHKVDLSSFRMGATPVTVGMWREYLRANPSLSMPKIPDWGWIDSHPMVNVSWLDIVGTNKTGGYCAWASRVAGVKLSLPSEAQWEYVAKGGKDSKYPWGNVYDDSKVWSYVKSKRSGTAPVNRLTNLFANRFGVSDLTGNVLQWCVDGYHPYAKSFDRLGYQIIPKDPVRNGKNNCVRGGSLLNFDSGCFRSTFRLEFNPDGRLSSVGFRLVAAA